MITFTLDTNCIVDVDENRSQAKYVDALIRNHRCGEIEVSVVAMSASERQKDGTYISNYKEFSHRLASLGFSDLKQIFPLLYWDVSFWGASLLGSPEMIELEKRIHKILFPDLPFDFSEFAKQKNLGVNAKTRSEGAKKWRNALCDRQMFWAHVYYGHDVFVTSDSNFKRKLSASSEFSESKLMTPEEACIWMCFPKMK